LISDNLTDAEADVFLVEATREGWSADDERWLRQAEVLYRDLRRADVAQPEVAQPGRKGMAETLIIALGSAGAFTAARDIFRAWFESRAKANVSHVNITIKHARSGREIVVNAENVDDPKLWDVVKQLCGK